MPASQLPPGENGSAPRRWLQAVLAAVVGTGLVVLAFFFALFALAAAALLVSVLAARWWWLTRRARRAARDADTVVEGEYRVVERESGDDGRPPGGRP